MDETKEHQTIGGYHIYSARVTFRKKGQKARTVNIQIRYLKKDHSKNEKFPVPNDIKDIDLSWVGYEGGLIATYWRTGELSYVNRPKYEVVHTELGQKLERLVLKAHSKNLETM